MANQTDGAPSKFSAEIVGHAFVEQFYSLLHDSPDLVYRFYQDCSMVTRPNPKGTLVTVTSLDKIKELIMSLDCKSYRAEILTADTQASHKDGVTVLVTGCLTGKNKVRRKFTELFFLAPQDNGYFVLNNVFRFVDAGVPMVDDYVEKSAPAAVVSSVAPVQEATEAINNSLEYHSIAVENKTSVDELKSTAVGKTSSRPSANSTNNVQLVVESFSNEPAAKSSNNAQHVVNASSNESSAKSGNNPQNVVEISSSSSEPSDKSGNIAQRVVETISNGHVDLPKKKSFASVVSNGKEAVNTNMVHVPSLTAKPSKPAKPAVQPVASPAVQQARASSAIAASNGSHAPNGTDVIASNKDVVEGKVRSVYVGGLPSGSTPQQVEQIFKKFGCIAQNGIQVRQNGQYCYGFVEFEDAADRDKVVQMGTIQVDGYEASIEEKRTSAQVVNGKTTYPGGRGGFHNDGHRRGNYARSNSGNGRRYGEGASRDRHNGDGYAYQNGGARGASRDCRNGDGHVYQNGGGRGGVLAKQPLLSSSRLT